MNKEINLIITLEKIKLISVNALYNAGLSYKGVKPVPYIYKTPLAKRFEAIMDEQLRAINWEEHIGWISETKQFTMTQQYIFKSGIKRRDVGNVEKLSTDCLVRFIRNELGVSTFDDALISDAHLYKSIIPGSQNEYLCIKLTPSDFNMRFDQIDKPEQILIHTSGDISWENKDFKKAFKDLGLKYQLSTTDKKIKDHNTDVYFLNSSSENFTEDLIDVMDFLYSHKDSGFCYVGIFGDPKPEIVKKLNDLGGSNIKAGPIKDYIDIINFFK